jgi:hypothetical protein
MAKPPEDPRIADLARYRKAREQQKRQPPPKPKRPPSSERFLGSNPRAGLVMAIVILLAAVFFVLPALL